MPSAPTAGLRRALILGATLALSLGTGACSAESDSAGPANHRPAAADHEKVAESALLSTRLEGLAGYEPAEPPRHLDAGIPFSVCEPDVRHMDLLDYVKDTAYQEFVSGDSSISAFGFALDGAADEGFAQMRRLWESSKCESFNFEGGGERDHYEYERDFPIEAPGEVAAKSWYGLCFDMTNFDTEEELGECRVQYVLDDDRISEISMRLRSRADNAAAAEVLTALALEALSGS